MKKMARQAIIKEIIESSLIETQEDLASSLRKRHIDVTQATVSRDIKEMMLIKVPAGDGSYRYAFPNEKSLAFSRERMARMMEDAVIGIDYSENIIVLKTLPGTANAVASTIDGVRWPEIIGTVAGDDNILVVVKPKRVTEQIAKKIEGMISRGE
ncbi:MAG: arginine repressor [Schwartzia sp.]|nr:arginine repressor [Schwartzia sp. (in: firmicutes)]